MRWWALLWLTGCSQAEYMGSFRVPTPAGSSVSLMTVLAKQDEGWLVLYDTDQRKELKGRGDFASLDPSAPFTFDVPAGAPFKIVALDGVMQDVASRSYETIPLTPVDAGAHSLTRVTLTQDSETLTLVSSGGALFAETPAVQPASSDTPGPLFAMNSVAGAGLVLPAKFDTVMNWHDAVSTYVPPNMQMATPCGASIVSESRPQTSSVDVPAGHFTTIQVTEVIDTCRQPNPPMLSVFQFVRWFARGVGPVRLTYTDANSQVHDYRLTSSHVAGGSKDLWPLQQGNSWTYEVHDGTGAVVNSAVTVSVSASESVNQP